MNNENINTQMNNDNINTQMNNSNTVYNAPETAAEQQQLDLHHPHIIPSSGDLSSHTNDKQSRFHGFLISDVWEINELYTFTASEHTHTRFVLQETLLLLKAQSFKCIIYKVQCLKHWEDLPQHRL